MSQTPPHPRAQTRSQSHFQMHLGHRSTTAAVALPVAWCAPDNGARLVILTVLEALSGVVGRSYGVWSTPALRTARPPNRIAPALPGRGIGATSAVGGDAAAAERRVVEDASRLRSAQGQAVAEITDEQLLTQTIDGDREAFATLVERYRAELLHFLIRFLASRSAAEDVFQETFLQVYTSARTFDPERRLKPWLFTIAANKARDHFRRNRRHPSLSLSAPVDGGSSGHARSDSFVDLLHDDSAAPSEPLEERERGERIRAVVDGLSPHHREILLLSYFQRMSYQQLSECLEIPLGTVKSRLHAAVASFASAWRAAEGESRDAGAAGRDGVDRPSLRGDSSGESRGDSGRKGTSR